ncbi:MAG: MarR family transcriptional regulator [Bacteroidota bacterium]
MEVKIKEKKRAICFDIKTTWLAISRMYNVPSQLEGITTNIGFVLLHIDDKIGTPATKIAPMMGMEPRSLTRMLAKLEERDYIYREPDKFDKRKVQIFLTPLGLQKKNRAKEVVIGFNKKLYNDFSEEDLDIFFHVLDSIHKILNTYDHASS